MLISDRYKFIVACPTKTGTNSLRGLVESWKRGGGDIRTLNLLTGESSTRHRVSPPPGREKYTRFMLVRQPYNRIVSMYEYLRRKEWEWCAKNILAAEADGGRLAGWFWLLDHMYDVRESDWYLDPGLRADHGTRPFMWTDTLPEMRDYLGGLDVDGSALPWGGRGAADVRVLRIEELERDWFRLADAHGADELKGLRIPHRNATPPSERLFGSAGEYWDAFMEHRGFDEAREIMTTIAGGGLTGEEDELLKQLGYIAWL